MTSDEPALSPIQNLNGVATGSRTAKSAAKMAAMRAEFLDFYDREYHRVVRFMIRAGASLPEAEDATQEAFLAAWRRVNQQPPQWEQIRNPALWIRIVARNQHRRPSGGRQVPTLAVAEVPAPRTPADDHEGLTAATLDVLAALGELDEDARTVMALHMDGYTSGELAQQLGMTDQKVRDTLKRARKNLAERLGTASKPRRRPNR